MIDLLDEYGEEITIQRNGSGDYVDGRWVPGSLVSLSITAVVVPLNASELANQISPSGLEDKHAIAVYSSEEIFEASESLKRNRDIIQWRGENYTVASVSHRYQIVDLMHFRAIAYLENS